MGIKEFRPISKIFSGIFLLTSLNFCPGIHSVGVVAYNDTQVALSGETVHLKFQVTPQVNQSVATIHCFSPNNVTIQNKILKLQILPYESHIALVKVNSSDSGMYRCELRGVVGKVAYWFLQVIDKGYQMPMDDNMTIVGALTAVLGISSVACSLYLFKGHVPSLAKRGSRTTEAGEAREGRQEHKDPAPQGAMATSPADVYASLEATPGSIYDTLEPTAARQDTGPGRAASGSSQGAKEKTPHGDQNQDALECFYENF